MKKGQLLTELLKQPQNVPLPVQKQILTLYAGIYGFLDDVDLSLVNSFEKQLYAFIDSKFCNIFKPYLETLSDYSDFSVDETAIGPIVDIFSTLIFDDSEDVLSDVMDTYLKTLEDDSSVSLIDSPLWEGTDENLIKEIDSELDAQNISAYLDAAMDKDETEITIKANHK